MIILHVIGLPHTILDPSKYSTCAFSMKALNMINMFANKDDFIVVDYSNEGSKSLNRKNIHKSVILNSDDFNNLTKRDQLDFKKLYHEDLNNDKLISIFTHKLILNMKFFMDRFKSDINIVLHIFGPNKRVYNMFKDAIHVESGIGYSCGSLDTHFKCNFRVFESISWMHFHYGGNKFNNGKNYDAVIPNYYNLNEWNIVLNPINKNVILFFGRLIKCKGIYVVFEVARRMPDYEIWMIGQGDITIPDDIRNITVKPPVLGKDRSDLLGNVGVLLMPTEFIEPFGGSATEANLCGTPVVSSNYGVFLEKINYGVNGYYCRTLSDYCHCIKKALKLDRAKIAMLEREKYDMNNIQKQYSIYFKQLRDVKIGKGWYENNTYLD